MRVVAQDVVRNDHRRWGGHMARAYASGFLTGVAISLGAALLAPIWRPALSRYGRPAVKATIKQGMTAYEITRVRLAELSEALADIAAEAQMELAAEQPEGDAAPAEKASGPG
jgi:hypothetical protein